MERRALLASAQELLQLVGKTLIRLTIIMTSLGPELLFTWI